MFKKMVCLVRGHRKIYWDSERTKSANVLGGIYTPFFCKRCGYHSQVFFYPRVDNSDLIELLQKATKVKINTLE